jgi:hypothetical protein
MKWMQNEMTAMVENSILNAAKVLSHVTTSEMEDLSNITHRNMKMFQSWQNHCLKQTMAAWSFWYPR